ncbi:MAG: hypothetical protein V1880_03155 [Patescibacteria group bacterium]
MMLAVGCATSTPPETPNETPTAEATTTPKTREAPATPAESAEAFRAKVEAKCLAKYPGDKKLRRKACIVVYMGAVRTACKLASEDRANELCKRYDKYCTPEVRDLVNEGLAFCDALAKDKEGEEN